MTRMSVLGALRKLDRHLRLWLTSLIFELRRTRREIVSPEQRPRGEPPIFVCGVHRSGTTLLRLILDSHSRIACPPESFFIEPLGAMLGDAKAMEGLLAMGFNEKHVLGRLRETASYFFEMYAAARGKARWADKTPSYVDCVDLIEALYGPDSRYLIIYRHGLDVACSIAGIGMRELDDVRDAPRPEKLVAAARHWSEQCVKLRRFQAAHAERCFELRYEELAREPEPLLRRLFAFLGEPFEAEVLRFHEQPHDNWLGLQDGKAANTRGFEPRIGTWRAEDPAALAAMLAEAGPMLEKLGYSADPGAA